MDSRSN